MMIIVSAVVAVALIVGAGIFFITKDDGGSTEADDGNKTSQGPTGDPGKDTGGTKGGFTSKPAPDPVDARLLNAVRVPKVKTDQVTVPGLWATDKIFAKTEDYKITGYPVEGGKPTWQIPLDGQVCQGWRGVTEDNLTAIVFEDHKPKNDKDYADCSEIGLVDLDAGKLVWQKHIEDGGSRIDFDEVTIGAGTVAAGGLDGGAAWSLDGKQLWAPSEGDCEDRGYEGSEEKLVAATYCGEYDSPNIKVSTVNPKTGDVISGYQVPRGIKDVHVVSADPLVLGLEAAGESYDVTDVWVIDDSAATGKLKTKISTRNGQYVVDCDSTNIGGCTQIVVSEQTDTIFMASEERSNGGAGAVNEIVAFSMKTGKTIGKADGDSEAATVPLKLDEDGYLIAYQQPTYRKGGSVWRIDPTTYKKDLLMRNPDTSVDQETWFSPDSSWVSYVNGRLYLGYVYASKPSGAFDNERLLAMGFGAG
ncbi:PQQ-binding-like beta-propeller repeat protein [Streptomyces pactum]|uniref:PQQ-binding-like beta-propeller repeat protein n=2 Tax=Streptomyces pactum TaxID=68249 RepID=A0ABS0NJ17_9ACTN|nr:PQQ-binding-like beta-propeller repeat protein [Streptomyces pactum]MBH5335198.1 PQQ-binding-like beta-propeller repeat protein [Streptomyces pactum]